jgi:hypothetical protein
VKLNRIEKAFMNNPARAGLQRWYEARLLERLGGRVEALRVLEVGCGRGVGTQIIFDRFGAGEPSLWLKSRRKSTFRAHVIRASAVRYRRASTCARPSATSTTVPLKNSAIGILSAHSARAG